MTVTGPMMPVSILICQLSITFYNGKMQTYPKRNPPNEHSILESTYFGGTRRVIILKFLTWVVRMLLGIVDTILSSREFCDGDK